ncbi:DUF2235 domain-containing protein [Flavobacterium sp. LS1R49]|uniref:DUF2235 domain-containing protein n=1 Tax=Flavobacterium shii TaxID=2987687 RepID=A0A9X2ZK07_9FLAO|nr:DUF2235 domain-containing protein [Flavobacterium shii]MCV9929063.1 DUF2235 domain-containing protein [Flavobacterium shii]
MSRYRYVKGNITEITGGNHNIYAKSGIKFISGKQIEISAPETTYGEPEKYVPKQPEGSVNVYVGMFFDGTGNNRFNSEKTYYSKINSNETYYKADTIPASFRFIKTVRNKDQKEVNVEVKVADRDSYWNPYSNIVKLHDLYKEKTDSQKDILSENGGHPEYGDYVILKQYVEGIGTEKDAEDDILGSAFGRGDWGVLGRVEQGIKNMVNNQFSGIPKDKKINKIVFDVFGFSRGAAAARHFCNEVKKKAVYKSELVNDPYDKHPIPSGKVLLKAHAGGLLGKKLKEKGYLPVGKTYEIEIRFLGVFDTVVGDMVVKENIGNKLSLLPFLGIVPAVAQASLETIKTSVAGLGIKKVFHIVAQNEWRENFSLTPTDAGYTLSMLGAHSDIGGGYASLDKYKAVVDFFDVPVNDSSILAEKQKVKEFYTQHYFSKDKTEIDLINTYDHYLETTADPLIGEYLPRYESKQVERNADYMPPRERVYDPTKKHTINENKLSDHYTITDQRVISNKHSLVAMYVMLQKAMDNEVPFYKDYKQAPRIPNSFEHDMPDDPILKEYLAKLLKISKEEGNVSYHLPTEMYSHICNKYVHLSAHYGGLDALYSKTGDHALLGNYGFINYPVPYTKDENGNISYKRKIYENR